MMMYGDIIQQNCRNTTPQWWPKYAYHFTDVANVVGILSSGRLYSRVQAYQRGVMVNDNASRQVIDMTETGAMAYARFYFRPLTPTQYYNEGYKHSQLRYHGDINANVPVPIFLAFDLEQLLSAEGTVFSALSQAGHGSQLYEGCESFARLPFEMIYSEGPCGEEVRRYRHAEILYPDYYAIDSSLKMILCRNECEKATLLNILRSEDQKAYNKYKDRVRVAREHTFQRNGLFVESVICHNDMISFVFALTPQKRLYEQRFSERPLSKLNAVFLFQWINKFGLVLYSTAREVLIDYLRPDPIVFTKLTEVSGASMLKVTMRIDDKIICVSSQPISAFELL